MNEKEIEKRIQELKQELAELETQRDESGIAPSETFKLIERWYGHCFEFDGIEEGYVAFILKSIHVDRARHRVYFDGKFAIWITSDTFLNYLNFGGDCLYPCGGRVLCDGCIPVDILPYSNFDWDEGDITEQIEEILLGSEIEHQKFEKCVYEFDKYADDFTYVEPLEEIKKEKRNSLSYQRVFGKL